jgi:hypothetical protein
MRTHTTFARLATLTTAIAVSVTVAGAQLQIATAATTATPADSTTTDSAAAAPTKATGRAALLPPITMQHYRPNDQRGINVFESPKAEGVAFTGFKLAFGAAFTQQFQGLGHSNTAAPKLVNGTNGTPQTNANQLMTMGHGFNNAVANAYVNAQIAPGIRISMTSYLSARHHNETWVKDGYLLIDDSPLDVPALKTLMQYVTVKAGHFEINYGDSHFRRTDNGNAMYNPLVGNLILDPFTTEVGGELYLRAKGAFVMGAITNGEVRGTILNAGKRAPAFYGKVGVDKQVTNDLRVRLTGSLFSQSKANAQTLYNGDRAGSRYYDVLENTASTETAQAWSGAVQPFSGQSTGQHSGVINPFLKYRGLEYFGTFERAKGRLATETTYRTVDQIANELTYRMFGDQLFVSGRYNTVSGKLAGIANDINVKRTQLGGGWFLTPTVMMKGEWVNQKYLDFPTTDIRNGGKFKGFMVEATVAF